MNKLQRTAASAIAAGALLANTALPILATTEIVIQGNGAGSDNYVDYNQQNSTSVQQDNTANVTNNVDVDADTGKNDANFNTGGDTVISTGDASVGVNVENDLNTNAASVDCCDQGDTDVLIEGNGAYSDNLVELDQRTRTRVDQDNVANVTNDVDVDADTGHNDANLNTGGDTYILTGSVADDGEAGVDINVSTHANTNVAHVGNDSNSDASGLSLRILGNGAGSDNWIDADLRKSTRVDQDNRANVTNDVDVDADTGYNDADFNTGGDVVIDTGKAMADVDVDNMLNFNHADIDCGCTWDVLAKIAGNGAEPFNHHKHSDDRGDNGILLGLNSHQLLDQYNFAGVDNDLEDIDLRTGKNDANSNTGDVDGDSDPAILTGNASADVNVSNILNTNSADDGGFDLGDWPWDDMDFDFSFDLSMLLAHLGFSLA